VERAQVKYEEALEKWGPDHEVGFPNTAYYLPVIYGILGIPVKTIGDMKEILERCRSLLPEMVDDQVWLPYLAPALEAGMATFFAEEIIEAVRYLEAPDFYTKAPPRRSLCSWPRNSRKRICTYSCVRIMKGAPCPSSWWKQAFRLDGVPVSFPLDLSLQELYLRWVLPPERPCLLAA
jgi:hypothetical protein